MVNPCNPIIFPSDAGNDADDGKNIVSVLLVVSKYIPVT